MNQIKKLNNLELSSFCEQASMLLGSGISVVESMQIMRTDATDADASQIIDQIIDTCSKGKSFNEALVMTEAFPEYVLNTVALGEESGNLDSVLKSLSEYYEREENIYESVRSAVTYPFVMIGMIVVVIFVLLVKVLPVFNQVFEQFGSQMTGLSASLLHFGTTLNRYSIIFISIFVLLVLYFIWTTKTASGKRHLKSFLNVFPLTRNCYESIAYGRFADGMALALGSGMDIYSSLDMVSKLIENAKIKDQISLCSSELQRDANFAEALTKAGIFSHSYARMIYVGFKTGKTDIILRKIADNYQRDTDKKIHSVISILEPTLVIILSLIVGLILLSVILPLMGIMANIG